MMITIGKSRGKALNQPQWTTHGSKLKARKPSQVLPNGDAPCKAGELAPTVLLSSSPWISSSGFFTLSACAPAQA